MYAICCHDPGQPYSHYGRNPLLDRNREVLIRKVLSLLDRYAPGRPIGEFFRWACPEANPQRRLCWNSR